MTNPANDNRVGDARRMTQDEVQRYKNGMGLKLHA